MSTVICIANRVALPAEPPSRVMLVPWGNVTSKSGDFHVDADGAASVVAAFKAHGADLVIDREHATLPEFAPKDGSAPAMGWVTAIHIEDGVGIFGDVTWTPKGDEYLRNKEYRYLSPVTVLRKSDRHLLQLHSVGLVNTPAIAGMVPVVNKETVVLDNEKLERTRWFLNLAETATAEEIMSELETFLSQMRTLVGAAADADGAKVIEAMKAKLDATPNIKVAVCKALKLDATAKDEDVVAAVNKAVEKPAAKDVVPVADHEKVLTANKERDDRIKALEEELHANKRSAFIERGEKSGQIVAANKGMWERSFDHDAKQAVEDLKTAPIVGPGEGRVVNTDPRRSDGSRETDPILAHSERFDPEAVDQYRRIEAYQQANKCTWEEACDAVS